MSRTLLKNVRIIDPAGGAGFVENGYILIDGSFIEACGTMEELQAESVDKTFDLAGKTVLPGMINAHTHLYSALALGMPGPKQQPENFAQILERVWWVLDRALDTDSTRASYWAGLIDCLRHGVTTVIDHHSSQNFIERSLSMLAEESERIGVKISLAFELTDRNGREGFQRGLAENLNAWETFRDTPLVHPMMGLHASFTLTDDSLREVQKALEKREGMGIHIHVAEDAADEADARGRGYASVIHRLNSFGLLNEHSLLIHGLHIPDEDEETVLQSGAMLVHNPSSNANNRVGMLPTSRIKNLNAGLGTDGMQANMLAEAKEGTLIRSSHLVGGEGSVDYVGMLFRRNAEIASKLFGRKIGRIKAGYAADLAIFEYDPRTDLGPQNVVGHLLFGMKKPSDVMSEGVFQIRDWEFVNLPEEELLAGARVQSQRLWDAMQKN